MSSFGEELKRERKLRKITLREISESTKINVRYLDSLERNDFRHLPGGIFNRGFVRAYSQYIGIDADAMVNAYLMEEQAQQEAEGRMRGDAFRPHRPGEPDEAEAAPAARRWPWVALALLVVVAAVAGFAWWRATHSPTGDTGIDRPAIDAGVNQ